MNEEKMVFAVGKMPDGVPVVILGISQAAWDYMKDGKTHTIDLTSLGHRLKFVLFGGKDRADVLRQIPMDTGTLNLTGMDFGFGSRE